MFKRRIKLKGQRTNHSNQTQTMSSLDKNKGGVLTSGLMSVVPQLVRLQRVKVTTGIRLTYYTTTTNSHQDIEMWPLVADS